MTVVYYLYHLPEFLYRGIASRYRVEVGDYIQPSHEELTTSCGDKGSFVFATADKTHAIAYAAFKDTSKSSIGIQYDNGSVRVFVILDPHENPTLDAFEEAQKTPGVLQKVSSEGFGGVFSFDQLIDDQTPKPFQKAGEYVSKYPVRVLENSKDPTSADSAIKIGVQVFTILPRSKRKIASIRKVLRRNKYTPEIFSKLIKAGTLRYENLRPEYNAFPKTRWESLANYLDVASEGFPSTPSHPQTPARPETRQPSGGNPGADAPNLSRS